MRKMEFICGNIIPCNFYCNATLLKVKNNLVDNLVFFFLAFVKEEK
jgi:hypothetical protein